MVNIFKVLKKKGIKIKIDRGAKNYLANEGYNLKYGVRHLRRKIQTLIENPISDIILKEKVSSNSQIIFSYKEKELSYKIHKTVDPKVIKEKNKNLPN